MYQRTSTSSAFLRAAVLRLLGRGSLSELLRRRTGEPSGSAIPPKPKPLPVLFDNIPAELRRKDRWVLWKYMPPARNKKKWDKPPRTLGGGFASSTNPATWATFAEVRAAYEDRANGWDGVGFVHLPEDKLTGVDLDKCRDPKTGDLDEWAAGEVKTLDTYAEASPSAKGVRAYARGVKPSNEGSKKGPVELYDGRTKDGKPGGRYLTITGHRLDGCPATINDRQPQIDALYHKTFATPKAKAKAKGGPSEVGSAFRQAAPDAQQAPPPKGNPSLSDAEVIARARAAKNGQKFGRLFDSEPDDDCGYPSASEADCALAEFFGYWTNGDRDWVERLFGESGRGKREKWTGRPDYRCATIDRALSGHGGGAANGGGRHEGRGGGKGDDPDPDLIVRGPLRVRVGDVSNAHNTRSAAVLVDYGGPVPKELSVTPATQKKAVTALSGLLPSGSGALAEEVVDLILARSREKLEERKRAEERARAEAKEPIDLVRAAVPDDLSPRFRLEDEEVYVEARTGGCSLTCADWVRRAAAAVTLAVKDAPAFRQKDGRPARLTYVKREVESLLQLVFGERTAGLPYEDGETGLGEGSKAAARCLELPGRLLRLHLPYDPDMSVESKRRLPTSRANLVARALNQLRSGELPRGELTPVVSVHGAPLFTCWVVRMADGELPPIRFVIGHDLGGQLEHPFPASRTAVGWLRTWQRYRVLDHQPPFTVPEEQGGFLAVGLTLDLLRSAGWTEDERFPTGDDENSTDTRGGN